MSARGRGCFCFGFFSSASVPVAVATADTMGPGVRSQHSAVPAVLFQGWLPPPGPATRSSTVAGRFPHLGAQSPTLLPTHHPTPAGRHGRLAQAAPCSLQGLNLSEWIQRSIWSPRQTSMSRSPDWGAFGCQQRSPPWPCSSLSWSQQGPRG